MMRILFVVFKKKIFNFFFSSSTHLSVANEDSRLFDLELSVLIERISPLSTCIYILLYVVAVAT